ARAGAEQEPAPLADGYGHDDGLVHALAHGVAVPGDAVAPVAVEVDVHGVEVDAVPLGQGRPYLPDARWQVGQGVTGPAGHEPWLEHLALVHPPLALLPWRLAQEHVERLRVVGEP